MGIHEDNGFIEIPYLEYIKLTENFADKHRFATNGTKRMWVNKKTGQTDAFAETKASTGKIYGYIRPEYIKG